MNEKRFRFDLFVALCALIISAVAAGASAYQTYVTRQQYSATVWPYLTFVTTSSSDKYFSLSINNVGIGPALIRSATVSRDGKPIIIAPNPTQLPAIEIAIASERAQAEADEKTSGAHGQHGESSLSASSLAPGDVIPSGSTLQILRVDGKFLERRVFADAHRIDLKICYCSLLGTCWIKRLWDPSVEPHTVAACPDA